MRSLFNFLAIFGGVILLTIYAVYQDRRDAKERLKRIRRQASEDRSEIIGDGAWPITRAKYPDKLSNRVRDAEPRGM